MHNPHLTDLENLALLFNCDQGQLSSLMSEAQAQVLAASLVDAGELFATTPDAIVETLQTAVTQTTAASTSPTDTDFATSMQEAIAKLVGSAGAGTVTSNFVHGGAGLLDSAPTPAATASAYEASKEMQDCSDNVLNALKDIDTSKLTGMPLEPLAPLMRSVVQAKFEWFKASALLSQRIQPHLNNEATLTAAASTITAQADLFLGDANASATIFSTTLNQVEDLIAKQSALTAEQAAHVLTKTLYLPDTESTLITTDIADVRVKTTAVRDTIAALHAKTAEIFPGPQTAAMQAVILSLTQNYCQTEYAKATLEYKLDTAIKLATTATDTLVRSAASEPFVLSPDEKSELMAAAIPSLCTALNIAPPTTTPYNHTFYLSFAKAQFEQMANFITQHAEKEAPTTTYITTHLTDGATIATNWASATSTPAAAAGAGTSATHPVTAASLLPTASLAATESASTGDSSGAAGPKPPGA